MLVLSRRVGERIVVPQCRLAITVSAVHGNSVRLAISAPAETNVYREEVWRRRCLLTAGTPGLPGDPARSIASTAQPG
jgi:carbon storage regulator CsrA